MNETLPSPVPILQVEHVTKAFSESKKGVFPTIEDLSFSVKDEVEGEFVALLGPSGCGKSTLLTMVAGLAEPTSGEIWTRGKLVSGANPDTVTVQQAYTCFPWLTAQKNVEFALEMQGMRGEKARKTAAEYLDRVGLGDRLTAYPHELSGGMQQRIALARALSIKAKILLMDEPFGALDAQTRADMQQLLLRLWSEEKQAVLFVTHDIGEAVLLADRVLVFSSRPARILKDVSIPFPRPRTPELLADPRFVGMCQTLLTLLKSGSQVSLEVKE